MTFSTLSPWQKKLLDMINQLYDEIMIYDDKYQIVYTNQACQRHYDMSPEEMIGKSFFDFVDNDCWDNSVLPLVYKEKKPYAARQKTFLGAELFTIAVPILDEQNKLTNVIMSVRDNMKGIELYNPNYSYKTSKLNHVEPPIAVSEKMQEVIALARKISSVDVTCILTGESGTGKTMLAKYIHSLSRRNQQPFINLNCASIPDNLIESELFGYEKGAFTGASSKGKKGLFEAANGGTLLLDEIAELPLSAQAKLLHVLQEQSYLPIGSSIPVHTDVRILAATNKNLKELVIQGNFREDLYYRLNIIELYIPSLKERPQDIPELCSHFLSRINRKYGFDKYFTKQAMSVLCHAEWKGNIRELQHIIERMVVTTESDEIDVMDLPKNLLDSQAKADSAPVIPKLPLDEQLKQYESAIVRGAYEHCGSSRKLAAYLDISQTRANNLIRKYVHPEIK